METLVEKIVSMPVTNPDTGRASRTFVYVGVVDKQEGGKVIDWKGTSSPDRFITRAKIGCQGECYALALQHQGCRITEIEYRLIQRPLLGYTEPTFTYAVMKAGRKSALKVCGDQDEAEKLAAMQGGSVEERVKGDKDRDAYEDRCLQQLLEQPQRVVSHPHFLTESRLKLAREWLWQCCKRILECRQHDRWMPNEQACFAYERECPYAPLCEAIADNLDINGIIATEFERIDDPHPELNGYEPKQDRETATYSSLSKLALCEVLYFWQYERRLRRRREDSEPLWIGSAMHRGMEVYATDGLEAALMAITTWAAAHPIIGPNQAWIQDQQVARARAMCRAAAVKWGNPPPTGGTDVER